MQPSDILLRCMCLHLYYYWNSVVLCFQIDWIEEQIAKKRVKRDSNLDSDGRQTISGSKRKENEFNDPMWPKLWYIVSHFSLLFYLNEAQSRFSQDF